MNSRSDGRKRTVTPISISIDPAACALAVVAIGLAWQAYRRSTSHIVRLANVESLFTISNDRTRNGPSFSVTLLNLGLPINRISVLLHFKSPGSFGQETNLGIEPVLGHNSAAFAPGMRGTFTRWPLSDPVANRIHLLTSINDIRDPRKQRVAIIISSDGFEVQRIPLYSRFDTPRLLWNRLLLLIIGRFDGTFKTDEGLEYRNPLGWWRRFAFESPPSQKLLTFVRFCIDENERQNRLQEKSKELIPST